MTDDEPGRRFSEAEMRAIMARAAKRQEQERAAEVERAGGFSLDELEQIAAAAGISPDHVVAAVGEVDTGTVGERRTTAFGAPITVERVRRLPGPLTDDAWARVVSELRRAFGEDGMAGQLGRDREWSAVGRGPRRDLATRLTAEPDGTGTRLTLRQSARDMVFGFNLAAGLNGVMAVVFSIVSLASTDPEIWIAVLVLTALAAFFATGVQVGSRIWARRQEQKFEGVLDRIELVARAAAPRAAAPVAPVTAAVTAPVATAPEPTAPAVTTPAVGRITLDSAADLEPDSADGARTATPRTRT
jgi:hypothetical protein